MLIGHLMKCPVCSSEINLEEYSCDYLKYNLKQKIMSVVPRVSIYLFSKPIKDRINNLKINKNFFGKRRAVWCPECHVGFASPSFDLGELDSYYSEFYWGARNPINSKSQDESDDAEKFFALGVRKYHSFKARVDRHIELLNKNISSAPNRILDFGCGNCIGSYHLKKAYSADVVSYDKSHFSEEMASNIGLSYVSEVNIHDDSAQKPDEKYDLIYSSHSLEHVHDLLGSPCVRIVVR